jgi:hypothetical protein
VALGFNADIDDEITFKSKELKEAPTKEHSIVNSFKFDTMQMIKQISSPMMSYLYYGIETMTDLEP